jgi:beta-galactosidase
MSTVLTPAARVAVTPDGLRIGDRVHRLLSGEVHPWRLDPAHWGRVLDAMKDLGFDTVSTYVSWAQHEVAAGEFDFSGSRDVAGFLQLVQERGMHAVLRLGPNTAAEQEDSGWPRRVLDDPACQARRPGGSPYLLATSTHQSYMPSYAAKATMAEITRWYDAVCAVVAPLQWPAGPVIACQVDNEIGFHFQSHAFALDYHPDTVEQYRAFLQSEYGDIAAINATYGSAYDDVGDIAPPTDGTEEPEQWRVDWVRFREHHLRSTLGLLAQMLRDRGIDRVPLVHNDYPRTATPMDLGALEASGAVDLAGADIYTTKEGGRFVRELARHLAGSSKLPYMAELGTGWLTLPWLLPMRTTSADEQHAAMRAWVHGVRAANVYMLVERDRWYGSPIAADGEIREPKADFYRRLHRLLSALDWGTLRRDVRVLVLENRDVARRVAARAVMGGIVPCFSQLLPVDVRLFDPDDPEADAMSAWDRAITAELDRLGLDADRASSSSLPDLTRYDVVAVFAPDDLDPAVRERLRDLVVVTDPEKLGVHAGVPAYRCDLPEVDVVCLTAPGREVLCAVNGSAETVQAKLGCEGAVRLHGRWYDEELIGDGVVRVELAPWAVQVWEVIR